MNKRELELKRHEALDRIEKKIDILLEVSGITVIENDVEEEESLEEK